MKTYYGTKPLAAKPMTRGEYNQYRGWELPADERADEDGYLVEYQDGGKPNTKEYTGYVSWSPKDVFEQSYRVNGELAIGDVMLGLEKGMVAERAGWNGRNMFVYMVHAELVPARNTIEENYFRAKLVHNNAHFKIKNVDGSVSTWVPSVNDQLGKDWSLRYLLPHEHA